MPGLIIDFETASAVDLKKAGAWRYSEDPTTECLSLSWGYEHQRQVGSWTPEETMAMPPALATALADPSVLFVAQNAGFEKAIWRNLMVPVFGWPDVPNSKWHDTMAVCAMRCVPLPLDQACRVMKIPYQKDKEGSKLTIGLSKTNKKGYYVRTPELLQRSLIYNISDIDAQRGLHERIGWLPPGERRIWLMNQRINERGFRLDLPLVRAMQQVVGRATVPLAREFEDLTGGLKFTQGAKIIAWVQGQGVQLLNMQKETLSRLLGGEDEDGEELEVDDDLNPGPLFMPPAVERALRIRQLIGSASVKKLARMHQCVNMDGRVRGTTQYHGAGTGREAGRLLQPTNFPRGSNEAIQLPVDDKVAAIMTGDPEQVFLRTGVQPVELVVGSLRHTIEATPGRELVAGDFAGIEARTVLALAGQYDKCDLLAAGFDAYIDMALDIFGLPRFDLTDKALVKAFKEAHTAERQTGKNCFAAETPVLTDTGWKPIVNVRIKDRLWDGEEWVTHKGLLRQGGKITVSVHGISATPEHPVLCGEQWLPWARLAQDENGLSQALATASVNFPFGATPTETEAASVLSWSRVRAADRRILPTLVTSSPGDLPDALGARRSSLGIGGRSFMGMLRSSQMKATGFGSLTGSALSFNDAKTLRTNISRAMAVEVSASGQRGYKIADYFWHIFSLWTAGISQFWSLIGKTMTGGMSQETCGSLPERSIVETNERYGNFNNVSKNWREVFDLADAGPRHRFTILTDAGPVIVHNSVLGCGFQMGWATFKRRYCADQPDEFAQQVVEAYRKRWAPRVPAVWRALEDAALRTATTGLPSEAYGVEYAREDWWLTARLPSGRKLWYFNPTVVEKAMPWSTPEQPDIRTAWTCQMRKGAKWVTVDMYGGILTENVVQALARDLLWEAVFKCENNGLPVVLTVYDEIVCEPEARPDNQRVLEQIMTESPKWAVDMRIPVQVEAWTGDRYRK